MIKLGIVGAENSHSYAIGKTCNIDKALDMRVEMIWGETPEFAKAAAEKGGIPTIVNDWKEMLGKVDGIMIDHRHALPHYEVAKFFVGKKVPTFVDKPLTFTLTHAKSLLNLAEKKKTPITTFSAIPIQAAFKQFKETLKTQGPALAINSSGPVDLESKYGGVFFYGIHQVDAIIELMGADVATVSLQRAGVNGIATLAYPDGRIATINCIRDNANAFSWQAVTAKGPIFQKDERDANPYLTSAKLIAELISTGKSQFDRPRMLAPVAVLEALAKSLKANGRAVKVGKLD